MGARVLIKASGEASRFLSSLTMEGMEANSG